MRLTVVRGPSPAGPFDLHEGTNHAGRDPACEVCLPSKRVSRKHAIFEVKDGQVEVRDLGSHNGILSGSGARVDTLALPNGGRVQVGDYLLKLESADEELDLEEDDISLDDETADSEGAAPPPFPPPAAPPRAAFPPPPKPFSPQAEPARPQPRSPTLAPVPEPAPAAGGVVPPPPKLPFAPASGFGGFGKRPLDPARSIIAEPEPAPPAPPAPWIPDAKPAAPPPPPQPTAPAPPPPVRPASLPSPKIEEPTRPELRPEPRPPSTGFPWMLQAILVLMLALGLLVCSPIGGIVDLIWSTRTAVTEVSIQRGVALAESLANRNAQPLADQRGIALETTFLLERAGVRAALVADPRGTVLAPAEKLRTSVSSQPAYAEASRTGEPATVEVGDLVQIAVPVRAQVGGAGPRQIVGYVLIDYDASEIGDQVASPILAAFQAFFVLGVFVAILIGGVWWLLLRPLAALREETELALLGDTHEVVAPVRLAHFEQLAHSINRLAARARGSSRR